VRTAGTVPGKTTSPFPHRAALAEAQVGVPSPQQRAAPFPFPQPLGPLCCSTAGLSAFVTAQAESDEGSWLHSRKWASSLPDWHLQGVERILQGKVGVNLIDLAQKRVYPRLPRVRQNHEFDPWSHKDRQTGKAKLRTSPGQAARRRVPAAGRYLSASGSSAA